MKIKPWCILKTLMDIWPIYVFLALLWLLSVTAAYSNHHTNYWWEGTIFFFQYAGGVVGLIAAMFGLSIFKGYVEEKCEESCK